MPRLPVEREKPMKVLKPAVLWGGALFISAIFLDSLRFKFTGHQTPRHIFETLKEWSGVGLFYPAGPVVIGLAELVSAALLIAAPLFFAATGKSALAARSQLVGAVIAIGVMSGAIVFHLFTPLGIATPTDWSGDTPTAYSPALFYAACASWAFAAIIIALRRNAFAK